MTEPRPAVRVGLFPWLPWPLRAMPSWTTPVRAERLAALRIALAFLLLLDVLTSYWPNRAIFFGPDSLGALDFYAWYAKNGRYYWSILRGPENDLNFTICVFAALGLGVWLVLDSRTRWLGTDPTPPRPSPWAVVAWCFFTTYALAGFGVRVLKDRDISPEAPVRLWLWAAPLALGIVAALFWLVEAWVSRHPGTTSRGYLRAWWVAAWLWFPLLVIGGYLLHMEQWRPDDPADGVRILLEPWLLDHGMIAGCLIVWAIALVFLIFGFQTRLAALVAWVMSTSFANVQSNIDNAGDTIRGIILFYLILCPCAAAWSLDSLLARRRRPAHAAVVVSPWPIGLLFTQMTLMYFMNGVVKLGSDDWRAGKTLYLVLHDLTLTRFSYVQLPITYELTRWLTWTTLTWELTFPLLILWGPTRLVALVIGVGFHLAIGLTMDLGFFAAYALCLYVPLLPWERLSDWVADSVRERAS